MVAIISGQGLGLFNGQPVAAGSGAANGQTGEQVYLNASTGNLILSRRDQLLIGSGPDLDLVRTYNSRQH